MRGTMHYHLVLTQKCNLNCTYCGNSVEPSLMPVNAKYSIQDLKSFLSKDNDENGIVLAFYGGEPALNVKRIMEVMDEIPARAFMIQTNGTLLHRIPPDYIKRFHTILISIDGKEKTTDKYRGKGTFARALKGATYAREHGFQGDLIARMTVSEHTDIYEEVTYLVNMKTPVTFNHVHWQLDALWDLEPDTRWHEFDKWVTKNYNPGITRLVEYWISHMETTHEILGIAPFLGITHTLLTKQPAQLRCGAGLDFFSITTDGRVTFCPIPPSFNLALVGDIFQSKPSDLPGKIKISGPCLTCEVRDVCGGRCLYTNKTMFWGEEGFNIVCKTVKHLIHELETNLPRIQKLIDNGILTIQQFKYPDIPNGVEIIP